MQVKMDVSKLIEIISENREKHIKNYNEAFIGYREKTIKVLSEKLKKAKKATQVKDIDLDIFLTAPQNFETYYDTVLSALKHTNEKEWTLTQDEYTKYVMDQWPWREQFVNTHTMYSTIKVKNKI